MARGLEGVHMHLVLHAGCGTGVCITSHTFSHRYAGEEAGCLRPLPPAPCGREQQFTSSLTGGPVCPCAGVCVCFSPGFDGKMKSVCGIELGLASFLCLGQSAPET